MQPNDPMQPQYNVPPQGAPANYPMPTQGPLAPPQAPMPAMPSHHAPIGLILTLVFTVLLLFGALGFGFWAFAGMQDYKTHSDAKAAQAVQAANEVLSAQKDKEFAEKEKSPFKAYLGPAAYGSLNITYPKTWSAYVIESAAASGTVVDGYMHPNVVPGVQSKTAFALRIQVISSSYDKEIKKFDGPAKTGKVRISPFRPAKVPGTLGIRVDGEINTGQNGSMVIFPLRDKTVEISTQAAEFAGDFNNTILPNLTFQP